MPVHFTSCLYLSKRNYFLLDKLYPVLLWLSFVLILFVSNASLASERAVKEYRLKSAFIYNFARLIEWPSSSFSTEGSSIDVCFIGQDDFGESLDAIQGKMANRRKVVIKRNIKQLQIPQCQLLFIASSEKENWPQIRNIISEYAILSISNLENFAQNGGHIRFMVKNDKRLSLEINLMASQRAKLSISSRILGIASIVVNDDNAPLGDE